MGPLPGSVLLLREAPAAAAAATAPVPAGGRTATDESPLSSATAHAVDSYRSVTSAASEPLVAAAGTGHVQPAAAFASSSPRSQEHREKRKQADARRNKREKRLKRPSILVDGVAVDVDVELLVEVVAGLGGMKVVRLTRL